MKKITLLTLALTACIVSFAQIVKGTIFTGGSVFMRNTTEETVNSQQPNITSQRKSSEWSVQPLLGTAVAENQIVGVFVRIRTNRIEAGSVGNSSSGKSNTYGGGVFYRRYYPVGKKFLLFGNADLGFDVGRSESFSQTGFRTIKTFGSNTTSFNLGITPGISWMVSPRLMLETSLSDLFFAGYGREQFSNFDQQGRETQNGERNTLNAGVNANAFNTIAVGVRWLIPRK